MTEEEKKAKEEAEKKAQEEGAKEPESKEAKVEEETPSQKTEDKGEEPKPDNAKAEDETSEEQKVQKEKEPEMSFADVVKAIAGFSEIMKGFMSAFKKEEEGKAEELKGKAEVPPTNDDEDADEGGLRNFFD